MVNFILPGQVSTFPNPWSCSKDRAKAGSNEKLLSGLMPTDPQIQYSPQVRAQCLSSVKTHFYLIVFLTAFPFIIRTAMPTSSQVILMRERFQKGYGWDFKCLLKYTQKSLHCKKGNALKNIFK